MFHFSLTEFQTQLHRQNIPADYSEDLLFKLFVVQNNLETLKLRLVYEGDRLLYEDDSFVKELIFHIFDNCLKLSEFHLDLKVDYGRVKLIFTYREFTRFIAYASNLRSLSLKNIIVVLNFSRELLLPLSPTNFVLDHLAIEQRTESYQFCDFILKECSKLTYLKLDVRSDDLLQIVFKNLVGM